VGFFAGASYEKVAGRIGTGAAIAIGVLVVGLLVVWQVRRRRQERAEQAEFTADRLTS
jgi:membrane-associated protein